MGQAIEFTDRYSVIPKLVKAVKRTLRTLLYRIMWAVQTLGCLTLSSAALSENLLLSRPVSPPLIQSMENVTIKNGTELLIRGNNNSGHAQILILRLDNADSSSYHTRVNQEFTLPEGPFELIIPLSGLKTSGKKPFKPPFTKMYVFAADMWTNIELNKVLINATNAPPEKTLALDFGSADSATFPGFDSIDSDSTLLQGDLKERVRTSGDALLHDGIAGIHTFKTPWPNGRWKLSLWSEDQGEWEYLPHFLARQIKANNTTFIDETFTIDRWITDVYLAGSHKEGEIDGDLWSLVGERRSGFVSKPVDITDGILTVELQGDSSARFLSALVLEPLEGSFAEKTQQQRRQRYLNQWPVAVTPYQPPLSLTLHNISQQTQDDKGFFLAARDTRLNLVFEIGSPVDDSNPILVVSPPRSTARQPLNVTSRYGHWRYERPAPNATALQLDDSYLRGDMQSLTLSNKRPRRLHVQINIPSSATPGEYIGKLQLFSHGELKLLDYKVRVLPTMLPPLERPVGLYLEPAPYYHWFKPLAEEMAESTSCDLSLLASYGFSTVAPALTTPNSNKNRQIFIEQLQQVQDAGFNGPVLAYSPLKRLLRQKKRSTAAAALIQLQLLLEAEKLPNVFWSIFDEPLKDNFLQIQDTANLLRDEALGLKTAGHMNNDNQSGLIGTTDLLIINHGLEVSKDSISELQDNRLVWLYNMPKPRLAAGFYLWRSNADGYLQWHGRMPTADPFDPTDGREGDVVYLYPTEKPCQTTMNIHHRLLDLHEATLDLRWLQWLEEQAINNPVAKTVLTDIRSNLPPQWKEMAELTKDDLWKIRNKIFSVAQESLNNESPVKENSLLLSPP